MVRLAPLCLNKHVWGGYTYTFILAPSDLCLHVAFSREFLTTNSLKPNYNLAAITKPLLRCCHIFSWHCVQGQSAKISQQKCIRIKKMAQFIYIWNVCWFQHVLGWCSLDCSSLITQSSFRSAWCCIIFCSLIHPNYPWWRVWAEGITFLHGWTFHLLQFIVIIIFSTLAMETAGGKTEKSLFQSFKWEIWISGLNIQIPGYVSGIEEIHKLSESVTFCNVENLWMVKW